MQVVYFGLVAFPHSQVQLNLCGCLLLGYLFYRYEDPLKKHLVYLRRKQSGA